MTRLPELLRALAAAEASEDPHRVRAARGRLHRTLRDEPPTDPLLAASCAAAVRDPDLKAHLTAIAAGVSARTGRALALVTDGQGQGRVVEVLVSLSPGGSGIWTAQDAERDAIIAAQLAVAVALGPQAEHWSARWQVKGADTIRGSSLGLAVAVATRAAQRDHPGPQDQAFTGGVDLDGSVAEVHGVPAKLRAAADAGLSRTTVPAGNLAGLRHPEGLYVAGAAAVGPLLDTLFGHAVSPATTSRRWRRAAVLLLPLAAAWTGLADPVDGLLQGPATHRVLGEIAPQWTAVLPLPETSDTRALRAEYPRVLQALAEAGASAVVLDVTLGALTEHDEALTASIQDAATAGMPVILPVLWRQGSWSGPGDPSLAQAAVPGLIELEADALFGRVRRAPVMLRANDGSTRWHSAALGLAAHLGASPTIQGDTLRIGVTRNPLQQERLWLPVVAPSPRLDWDSPGRGANEKVVLIGRATGRADQFKTAAGRRYGVEIHAAMVETLAAQAGLRRVTTATDTALAALTGLLTVLLGLALPRSRRLLVFLVPTLGLGMLLLGLNAGWLVAPVPMLAAGLLGWWVVR